MMIIRRAFTSSSTRYNTSTKPSILKGIDLDAILSNNTTNEKQPKQQQQHKKPKSHGGNGNGPKDESITGPMLNDIFRNKLSNPKPARSEISHANHLFNISRKKLNWIVYEYSKIPGEEERSAKEQETEYIEEEPASDNDITETEAQEIRESEKNRLAKLEKRKQQDDFKNNLPEILLLGRCNVGKSSLINTLFNDLTLKNESEFRYAKVKDHPGFTQSLNFYNIGGLLRVVDSPGYGEKGKPWQGELTLEYIENRRNLRKVYILASAKDGLKSTDDQIVDFLLERRIPFDFILTKIDKLTANPKFSSNRQALIKHLKEFLIPQLQIENHVTLQPNFHFVNSVITKLLERKTGIDELRVNILKSCGYEKFANLRPIYKAKLKDKTEKAARRVGELDKR